MEFKKMTGSISEQRELEQLRADVAEQAAVIDYLAIMTDVEIPTEETEVMHYE